MKIDMVPQLNPTRGGSVKVGNVYTNPHGKFYKIVVAIVTPEHSINHGSRFNNVVMLHISTSGHIVGSSNQPMQYISQHQDLVGIVKSMPTLKIEWLKK